MLTLCTYVNFLSQQKNAPPITANLATRLGQSLQPCALPPGIIYRSSKLFSSCYQFLPSLPLQRKKNCCQCCVRISACLQLLTAPRPSLFSITSIPASLQSHSLARQTPPRPAPPDAAPRTVAPLPPLEKPTASYYGAFCVAD